ncbi:MAG TPA: hypothetical protein VJU79_08025 [Candidatus Dormibacteraeota bacterium]|nr:hypothetical protein [Candidatus Dormibacteraeota bacterium]
MSTQQEGDKTLSRTVVVRMRDDELIEGVAEVDLDRPDLELQLADPRSNNKTVIIPFASVKHVVLDRHASDGEFKVAGHLYAHVQKAVLRFWDGAVLKGYLRRMPRRHGHAIEIELLSIGRDSVQVLAIPYSALKGVFVVKAWDSRAGEFVRETGHWRLRDGDTPLVDLLGEIRSLDHLREKGSLSQEEFVKRRRFVLDRI